MLDSKRFLEDGADGNPLKKSRAGTAPVPTKVRPGDRCPYLDTIDRHRLDFDFERVCSVTLLKSNVYACLVCGRYFQGRGDTSPAYHHSINDDHHVFMNLATHGAYCLPENYEIFDRTIDDIKVS